MAISLDGAGALKRQWLLLVWSINHPWALAAFIIFFSSFVSDLGIAISILGGETTPPLVQYRHNPKEYYTL